MTQMPVRPVLRLGMLAALGAVLAACGAAPRSAATPTPGPGGGERLPAVPPRAGALTIDVVYPGEGQTMGAVDSTFVFGNVGTGQASLSINGTPVTVASNGAFLAYLPIPADGAYRVAASAAGQTQTLTRQVRTAGSAPPPAAAAGSAGGPGPVGYELTLPDSSGVPAAWTGVVTTSRDDGTAIGTAVPGGGTPYHWFFPQGTRLVVTGSTGGQLRVRLTDDLTVWVDSAEVRPLDRPGGLVARPEDRLQPLATLASGSVGNVVATPYADYVDIRLATSDRFPFRVDGSERGLTVDVYGVETRTNNLLYGATDPVIDRMAWEQVSDDLYRLHVELNAPLWGFQSFFDEGGALVVRVRRPPAIDAGDPLRGRYIGVDAGHPPGGAIGPTRLTEAEVTLGVSRRLAGLLEARGARVLQTRPDTAGVGLGTRPLRATQENVDLLVSIHMDAFGDGVNPFENHGTHVFYNQAQSLDLARAIQRELLAELGLRDLGVSRRDLALVRPTWMPSILSESAFMMIPRNEAALRDPAVLDSIARAHLRGIEAFLRARAVAN